MTLSYQLTFDDYREAHTGVTLESRAKSRRSLIGWLAVLVIAASMLFVALVMPPAPVGAGVAPRPEPSRLVRIGAAAVPTVVMTFIFGYVVFRQAVKPLPKPWEVPLFQNAKPKKNRGVFGWIVFIGLAATLFAMLNSHQISVPTPPTPSAPSRSAGAPPPPAPVVSPFEGLTILDFVPGIIPWLAMFVMLIVVSRMGGDRNLRRSWEAQPFLQRPETLEIDASGLTFAEPMSRKFYAWPYFPGFKETPNLFLVYVSPLGFHIIPKRAFAATPQDLDLFRGYLLNEVKSGQFIEHPAAFPVVPMARLADAPGSVPAPQPPTLPTRRTGEPVDRV